MMRVQRLLVPPGPQTSQVFSLVVLVTREINHYGIVVMSIVYAIVFCV